MPMFKSKYYLHPDIIETAKKMEDDIKVFKYDNDFDVYHDAIILPLKNYPETRRHGSYINAGGVCDKNFRLLAGYVKGDPLLDYDTSYIPKEIVHSDETVIFSGDLNNQFGHFIQDSMSRLWYAVKHKKQEFKVALLLNSHWLNWEFDQEESYQIKFINLLGIKKERIIIVEQPTQFKQVIVPKQSVFWSEGFNSDLFKIVYDAARASVSPKNEKKIYLSRSKSEHQDIYNESYFERFFEGQGYKILNPELLPLEEQIAYAAGADEIACTYGTLSHWSLFAKDNTKLINLLRYPYAISNRQLFIDRMRNLDSVYIDTTLNILPAKHVGCPYIVGPTVYWQDFLQQEYSIEHRTDVFEYLNNSGIHFGNYIRDYLERLSSFRSSYKILFGYDFDYANYLKSLYMSFNPLGYGRLIGNMIISDNPHFRERLFKFIKGKNQNSRIIRFLGNGHIYPLDGIPMEEQYWSCLNNRLYLMDKDYTPIAEFSIPDTSSGRDRIKSYHGAMLSDISVYCSLTALKPGHRLRNYILRHLVIKKLVGKKPYKKLKKTPDRFFADSKSRLIRFLGKLYVRKHNTIVFDYRNEFLAYFNANNIHSKASALKEGMDKISREYVEHFLKLSRYWYRIDYAGPIWTKNDYLKGRQNREFEESFEQPFPEILWVTPYFFINNYCLGDLPDDVLKGINGKTIIDGGGYNGDTALVFHKHFPNSEIHVFEPLRFYTSTIEKYLAEDNCDNKIIIINKGLDEREGSRIIRFEVAEQLAHLTTLDDFYKDSAAPIGLLKIDTASPEKPIIKGAKRLIQRDRPVIAAAMYYTPEDFFELKDMLKELNPDYRFMIRRNDLRLPQTGLMLVAY